jgi:hypothetical protein
MPLRDRKPPEPHGLREVARHALARGVEIGQGVLGVGVALIYRPPIQPRGLCEVLGDAVTVLVATAEADLRVGIALVGSPQSIHAPLIRHAASRKVTTTRACVRS